MLKNTHDLSQKAFTVVFYMEKPQISVQHLGKFLITIKLSK